MSNPAPSVPRPATYGDLDSLPDNVVGEIIEGELIVSPRPAPKHAASTTAIGSLLFMAYQRAIGGPGGWWILFEPELHLGSDALVPDVAGWRIETLPELPEVAYFDTAPDWVCEVLSPSTERLDRVKKLAAYATHGVAHVWFVHPVNRTLEVLRLDGQTYRIVAIHDCAEDGARAEPFGAVALPLTALWSPPARPDAPEDSEAPSEPESEPESEPS